MISVRIHGGHRLQLRGAPSLEVETLPAPGEVWLSRRHRFVEFTDARVVEGDRVTPGQVLAMGAQDMAFPLVAPVAGLVTRVTAELIALAVGDSSGWSARAFTPMAWQTASAADIGERIRAAGLWPTLYAAPDGEIPWRVDGDMRTPEFVVIGAAHGEPYLAHPTAALEGRVEALVDAAAILQRVSGARRVIVAATPDVILPTLPDVEEMRVPARAPNDNVLVLCDTVQRGAYAWGVDVQDALAMRDAVVDGRAETERVIALAGGLVHHPKHLRVKVGTPLRDITGGRLGAGTPRIICGGTLSGERAEPDRTGLPPGARGVNVLTEPQEREFLAFLRPGGDRDSYMGAFLSALFPGRPRDAHAGIRGERRTCVNCTACQWVCPVDLMPSILWKHTVNDMVDEAAALGLRRCVECGLCTYVCPSKLELSYAFREAHATLRAEAAEERALRTEQEG